VTDINLSTETALIDPVHGAGLERYLLERRLTGSAEFYPWQRRFLNDWLLADRIPEAVDVPTGLGKTKVLTAWLIAKALGVPLPRRLVYIVDRRVVVDQATDEATALVAFLRDLLNDEEIEAAFRKKWRSNLGLNDGIDLPVSTLRGKLRDNRKWLERPHSAAIVIGTVDMIGSRLLFSGYGVSRGMLPVHAGLLGADSLFVLDEAHLVPPFEVMLHAARDIADRDRNRDTRTVVPRIRVMSLSATGRSDVAKDVTFALDDIDRKDERTKARLFAAKRVTLYDAVEKKTLASALANRAWAVWEETRGRVLVFCDSRLDAQSVETALAGLSTPLSGGMSATELLVGERRARERLLSHGSILERFSPDASPISERPMFLIATAAGEVGIDLDADHIVCDLVSWERMVQRFGRVNRRSRPASSSTISIIPSTPKESSDAKTRTAIERMAVIMKPFESTKWRSTDGTIDACPQVLAALKNDPDIAAILDEASSPKPHHPPLSKALIEAWALTSLREHPGRTVVAPWIRGWISDDDTIKVAWRKHFPIAPRAAAHGAFDVNDLSEFFGAYPIETVEVLEAPAHRVSALLLKRAKAYRPITDDSTSIPPVIVLLNSQNEVVNSLTIDSLRSTNPKALTSKLSGCTVVIDVQLGGLANTGLLDDNFAIPPLTIDGENWDPSEKITPISRRRVRFGPYKPGTNGWRPQGFAWSPDPDESSGDVLWVEMMTGKDADLYDSAVTKRAQCLIEHHEWTGLEIDSISAALMLPDWLRNVLGESARFHDAGKSRSIWQCAMGATIDGGSPYAKTLGRGNGRLLNGYRHEFGSVVDASKDVKFLAMPQHERDLVLHLIGAHHGHLRPTINPTDEHTRPSESSEIAADAIVRYARLQEVWGPWGLAWLEALIRCADWAASSKVNADA